MYVCSLSCPIYYVWSVWLNHIFPHYLINGIIFGKKLLNIKCVSIFSTSFFRHISHSKNSTRYYHAWAKVFMPSTHHSCQILQIISADFWITLKYQISWKSLMQMDRHDTASKCFAMLQTCLKMPVTFFLHLKLFLWDPFLSSPRNQEIFSRHYWTVGKYSLFWILGERSSIPSQQINTCTNGLPQTSRQIQPDFEKK